MADDKRIQDDIDPDVLDRALRLIRDCYGSADKSVYFLETHTGVSAINSGIANQRDCFSHFVTLLKTPGASKAEQVEQINGMQEHLRRAVLEPPIIAVNKLWERFEPVQVQYQDVVLTLPRWSEEMPGCPAHDEVTSRIDAIRTLREKARAGKGENRWDQAWEIAVADAVEAFRLLTALKSELERYITEAKRIRAAREDRVRSDGQFRRGLAIGGVLSLIGSAVVGWALMP